MIATSRPSFRRSLLPMLLTLAVTPALHAYVQEVTSGGIPLHWNDAVPGTPNNIDIYYDFRTINGYANVVTPAEQTVYQQVLADYNTLTGGKLNFIQNTTASSSSILVLSVGDLAAVGGTSGPGGTLGITSNSWFLPDGNMARSWVQLDSAETWDLTLGNGNPSNTHDFYDTAFHEIGHALGLDHSDNYWGNIMNTLDRGEKLYPSQDDINGLAATYTFNAFTAYSALAHTITGDFNMNFSGFYNYSNTGSPNYWEFYINTGVTTVTGAMNIGAAGFINPFNFRQSGGSFTVNNGVSIGTASVGNGPGLLELSAGTFSTSSIAVNTSGTLSLVGGRLNATAISLLGGGAFSWTGGTLSLTGPATLTNISSLTVPASGALLTTGALHLSSLAVNGTATLLPSGTGNTTSKVSSLVIAGGTNAWTGKLDLTSNALAIQTPANKLATLTTLANQILSGKNGGTWTGNGITSSSLVGTSNSTLALIDNADLNLASFNGEPLDSTSILITKAFIGDINLDGNVDLGDYDRWYSHVGATGFATSRGDINLDGNVDLGDYDLWYSHVGASTPLTPALSASLATVPEPASALLLAAPALSLLRRKRG